MFIRKKIKEIKSVMFIVRKIKSSINRKKTSKLDDTNAINFNDKIRLRVKKSSDPIIGTKMGARADKYGVRSYISEMIGNQYLVNLLHVCEELDFETWDKLPSRFVIKTNFGTGSNHYHIVTDKSKESFTAVKEKFIKSMLNDWYLFTQEMAYSYIERKIIIEQYISGLDGNISPDDYRIHVFRQIDNSFEFVIQIDTGKFQSVHKNFYDENFNLLNIHYNKSSNFHLENIPKIAINKMMSLSEKLMGDLTYARIDWYLINEEIIFGEITNTPCAGLANFSPASANLLLGEKIKYNDIFK